MKDLSAILWLIKRGKCRKIKDEKMEKNKKSEGIF